MNIEPTGGRQRGAGFSLIEVVVVLAILATIAAYAMPAYREYLARGYRIDAVMALYRAAQFLESNRAERSPRVADANTLPSGFDQAPVAGVAVYRLNVLPGNHDDGGYTLQAQPVDAGPMRDDVCGSFVLDATGKRSNHAAGARAPPGTRCWLAH